MTQWWNGVAILCRMIKEFVCVCVFLSVDVNESFHGRGDAWNTLQDGALPGRIEGMVFQAERIPKQSQVLSRKCMSLSVAGNVGSRKRGGREDGEVMRKDEAAEIAGTRFGGFVARSPFFILFQ